MTAQAAEQYRYDELGRLISVSLDDGALITYQYDVAGNRTTVTSTPGDPANDPPIALNDVVSTSEDVARTVAPLLNDSDPQGQSLSLIQVGAALHGTTSQSGNSVVYTPGPNFFGADHFDYQVSDGQLISTASVTVSVISVNDPPIAVNDATVTTEDTSTLFDPRINDTDIETGSDSLVIVSATNGTKGTVTIESAGTRLRYTPLTNANGPDQFSYSIEDADEASSAATVQVDIAPVNDPVVAVNDTHATQEDVSLTFDPLVNDVDPDGSDLTITDHTNGARGTVTVVGSGRQLVYRPNANWAGTDTFSYTVSDGHSSDTASVLMSVEPVNDAPVAVDDSYTNVSRDGWTRFNVLAGDTDPDQDALTIVSTTGPLVGEARVVDGGLAVEYRYTAPFLLDADGFRYTIRDTGELVASANVHLEFEGGGGFPNF